MSNCKFRLDDRVRVTAVTLGTFDKAGVVVEIKPDAEYPIRVAIEGQTTFGFAEHELVLAEGAESTEPPRTKIYIAGPMTGYPEFNYPAFHAADKALTDAGFETLNPANNPEGDSWTGYMRAAIGQLIQADAVAYLPDAAASRGARVEMRLADTLGIKVLPLGDWLATEDAA